MTSTTPDAMMLIAMTNETRAVSRSLSHPQVTLLPSATPARAVRTRVAFDEAQPSASMCGMSWVMNEG